MEAFQVKPRKHLFRLRVTVRSIIYMYLSVVPWASRTESLINFEFSAQLRAVAVGK